MFTLPGFSPPYDEYPPPNDNEPPLHRAARTGDVAEVRRLIAAGADIESTFNTELDPGAYSREATPLMIAAGSSDGANVETLRVLLELGASPARVINDRTAVTFACEGLSTWHKPGGDAARLRFLLGAGCPLPADKERANTLLCRVARAGDVERVRVLLEHGVAAGGYWDATKAREEAMERMREDFDSIVAASAKSDAQPGSEADADSKKGLRAMLEKSMERRASAPFCRDIPLCCAAHSGNAACVRALLEGGANAHARDWEGNTALHYASSEEVVRALAEAGLSLQDNAGTATPALAVAVREGEVALPRVRALIAAGANVNAADAHGFTPFLSAVGSERYPALLRTLIAAGANPHAVTRDGCNAFHAAIDVTFEANAEESVRDTLGYLKELGVDLEQRSTDGQTPLAYAICHGTALEARVLCELGADPNAVCTFRDCGAIACERGHMPLLVYAARGPTVERDETIAALLRAGADPLVCDEWNQTALAYVVADLCEDADDRDAAYRNFHAELSGVPLPDPRSAPSRDAFLEAAGPVMRTYVETFASPIPIKGTSEFAAEFREEYVNAAIDLVLFTVWAKAQGTGPESKPNPAPAP